MTDPLVLAKYEACKNAHLPRSISDRYEIVLKYGRVLLRKKDEQKQTEKRMGVADEELGQLHGEVVPAQDQEGTA